MIIENLGKEHYLKQRMSEFNELRSKISGKIEELSKDEKVKKYIGLMRRREAIDKVIWNTIEC